MASTINANVSVPTLCVHQPLDSTAKLNYTYRNKLINGDFSCWQRGINLTLASPAYTADRWYTTIVGAVTRQAFAAGESELMDNDEYYLNMALAYGPMSIEQRIEDVRTLAGKSVTLTFWAKATGGSAATVTLTQYFGSGGSASVVTSASSTVTILTSWSKHTVTIALPSVASKTIGTGSDHYLALKIAITGATFDISHVQLEQGLLATDFEKRHPGEELRMAKRYYERLSFANIMRTPLIGQCSATTEARCILSYISKRIVPTLTVPSDVQILDSASAPISTSWATNLASNESVEMIGTVAAGLVAGDIAMTRAANATYIEIDSEL